MGFLAFVIVFSLLIFVHEFGHFIVAKSAGVQVSEFGFGYPPRLLTLGTWRGTRISLNALPIGGFVHMAEDDPTVPGSLALKSRSVRALVYVAGALMNVLLAVVLYSITYTIGGLEPVDGPGVGIYEVAISSPAEQAGLLPGDTIISIDGQAITSAEQAGDLIQAAAGQTVVLTVRRDGELLPDISLIPRVNPPQGEGAMGVGLGPPLARVAYPVWRAIPKGIVATYNTVLNIYYSIQTMIQRQLPFQVTGVVGIYEMTRTVAKTGITQLLDWTAFLSINLFLVNLLPLPPLDGGRLVFVLLEWLRGGRKIAPEKEGLVHAVGMALLLVLFVVIAVADVMRYYG